MSSIYDKKDENEILKNSSRTEHARRHAQNFKSSNLQRLCEKNKGSN